MNVVRPAEEPGRKRDRTASAERAQNPSRRNDRDLFVTPTGVRILERPPGSGPLNAPVFPPAEGAMGG